MNPTKLTDYQIVESFGTTLSTIYKKKVAELNSDLEEVYAFLDKLDVPQYTDFDRWIAREMLPDWAKEKLGAIKHINRIRKIKQMPNAEELDISKAKAFPIENLYPFAIKRGGMVCCPLHRDNTPSMKLNKNNTVKCFSCGFYGDSIKLFMTLNNVDFRQAVTELGKLC